MTTLAIVQARMGSTRLPGKVLMDLAGAPMLQRVVNRLGRARGIDGVVVATTDQRADQPLADFCAAQGWPCYQGSTEDVLDRYYQAARTFGADVVVRVTSDCPLIDPGVLDRVIASFAGTTPRPDYAANVLPPRTFPRGLDTEVFSLTALERAWNADQDAGWREHVTPYLYRSGIFTLLRVANETDQSTLRWTVDTPEDLAFVLRVYEHFGHDGFDWHDVLALLDRYPELAAINSHIEQKAH